MYMIALSLGAGQSTVYSLRYQNITQTLNTPQYGPSVGEVLDFYCLLTILQVGTVEPGTIT